MTDFAAAVASYREALARFDAPPLRGLYADADPRWPEDAAVGVWLDYTAVREPAVIAEEAEMERRYGCTTRGTDEGGGERRGHELARAMPINDFRPPRRRVMDALRKMGRATIRQLSELAQVSTQTAFDVLRRESMGRWVKCLGGRPKVWEVRNASDARPAAEAAPRAMYATVIPVRNAAPSAPQEVEKMGKPKNTDEQIIAAIGVGPTTTGEAATKLGGVCPEGLTPRLEKLRDEGRIAGGERGTGTGRPRMWSAGNGGKPPRGASAKADRSLTKKAKRMTPQPQIDGLAETIAAAVEREAKRRCAAILRAHAESIEAELAGSAA